MSLEFAVSVAWWNPAQRDMFLESWGIDKGAEPPEWLFLQQDEKREGGSKTKNRAIRRAVEAQAELVVVLDDDCFPYQVRTLPDLARSHARALEPQPVRRFKAVTSPPSRGTPYEITNLDLTMPVAASMGFWTKIGDYCAPRQLVYGATNPMRFDADPVFGQYFPMCGMNYAFRPARWDPWYYLVEGVGRFDDIWMGWLWQRRAYDLGYCFNLGGPLVMHSRQSNVWANLRDEASRLEKSETLWRDIAVARYLDYDDLVRLIPK